MNDFRFASPVYLFLLLALPVLGLVLGRFSRGARDRLLRFVAQANLDQLLISKGTIRDRGRRAAFWAGLALAIVALARPQANPTTEEIANNGLDIYVLLDVSRSMDAEDVAPSRLKKAKRTIQHIASRLSGDRLGVIAFANSAVLVTPLTSDYSIIDVYLRNIDTALIPSQGTNLSGALETAREAMNRGSKTGEQNSERSNIFVIMSDGEDNANSDLTVTDEINKSGGLIFSIAFGTEKGGLIPLRDDKGELRGHKTDHTGTPVLSAVKPEMLKEAARRGGGYFYFSTLDEGEVEDLLARVSDAQRGSYAVIKTTVYEEWYAAFLAPGVFLLLVSFVPLLSFASGLRLPKMPEAVKYSLKRGGKTTGIFLLLLPMGLAAPEAMAHPLSFLWTKEKQASEQSAELAKQKKYSEAVDALKGLQAENPDSGELNYNIGTYQLAEQKHSQGREQLQRLRSADDQLRIPALFNTAGSWALEGKKPEARGMYAELIQRLAQKQKLSSTESTILEHAKRNLARLADPASQPPPQPDKSEKQEKKGGGGSDGKKNDSKDGEKKEDKGGGSGDKDKQEDKNKGDQGKGDTDKGDKDKGDKDKGDKEKSDKEKGDQDKEKKEGKGDKDKDKDKDEKNGDQEKGDQDKGDQKKTKGSDQGKGTPTRGGQPFKERDNMGEEEAKVILGALKAKEGTLQKKFLNDAVKGGKVKVDDAAKDW